MTTGERIAARRKVLKMSQEDLAFALGTHQPQISQYERGINDPTSEVLSKIADALNTTADYLIGRTTYVQQQPTTSDLSDDEIEIVTLLRMNPKKRRAMINVIKELAAV